MNLSDKGEDSMFEYKIEGTKVIIDVKIDDKEWNEGVEKTYENTKGKFNIEGFRKGHVPKKVIEQHYGDDVFYEDTLDFFIRKTLNDFLQEHAKLEPVSYPNTKLGEYVVGDGITFTIEFEIMPEFKLPKYTGLEFKKDDTTVKEKEVEHEIHHLLEDNASYNSVERESKMKDEVIIDFVGSIDGVEFEGGRAEDFPLELGSHSFIDNFEDQLVGKKKGDKVDVNVKFPDDYGAKEYAGKKALFKVTIKDVREKTLPTFDDKFVSNATEFETVEEYKKHTREHIQSMKENQADYNVKHEILKYIVDNTKMEVPESLIKIEVDGNVQQLQDACRMYQITLDDYLSRMGTTIEEYRKSCEERAVNNIKSRYVLRQIIEENNITASNEETEAKIKELPQLRMKKELTQEDRIYAENGVLLDKTYNFLRDNNKIVESDKKESK